MYAIATFSRGTGSCYDEEIRIFVGSSKEEITTNIQTNKEKYFVGWSSYVEFEEDLVFDKENSAFITARYS